MNPNSSETFFSLSGQCTKFLELKIRKKNVIVLASVRMKQK